MPYIPQLTGLFDPVPYKAPEDAMQNNLNTMGALQDPSGMLERLQSDQIIKGMADLKTEGISGLYSQHALNAIQGFQDYSKGLYKSRKGFNRLTLSGQQQLDESQKYRELLTDVNSLKELTTSYNSALKRAAGDVEKQVLTPENYKAFEKLLDQKNAEAKSIGDLPDAMAVYNNFLGSIYNWGAMDKEFQAAMKNVKPIKDVTTVGGERYNTEQLDPIPISDNLFDNNQRWRSFWIKEAGGDSAAGKKLARSYAEKSRIDNKTYGGQSKESFYEWKKKEDYKASIKGKEENVDVVIPKSSDSMGNLWDLSGLLGAKRPVWSGTIYEHEEGKDGEMKIKFKDKKPEEVSLKNAEVLSIHSDGTKSWMVVRGYPMGVSKGDPYLREVPVSRTVLAALKDKGVVLNEYYKEYGGSGKPVKIQSGSDTPPELKGNEPASSLVKGKIYQLDGKHYKWDGKNLIEQ